jgi:hypothetical protein
MALLGRTLLNVLKVNPGFNAGGVLTLQVSLPTANYSSDERLVSFYLSLKSALDDRFGPGAVSIVDELPLTGDRGRGLVSVRPADARQEVVIRTASPDYFDVMRIPVIDGRSFESGDNSGVLPRVVVSQSAARSLFGAASPVGHQLWLTATAQAAEVVGVVGDVKHRALDETLLPTVYLAAWQAPSPSSIVVVRSPRPEADVVAAVREEGARLDGSVPVYRVRPMEDVVSASPGVPERRLLSAAFTSFALIAVVLSAIGLFGVAAHDVASRRTEFALRIALGADSTRILVGALSRGALMVGAGLALGGLLSIWATRALNTIVRPTGPGEVFSASVAAAVLVVTGAAAILPAARRAARTDALMVLRGE